MKRTAVDWFVSGLKDRGVEWIAALCGHGLDPLFGAARAQGVRIVDVRNEQSAGYIAECYGRLTRRPGVCASSSGVAVANALTGAMSAWFDNAPMLYISGSADFAMLGMAPFQDSPQVEMAAPVCKWSTTIDRPHRVMQMLDTAWKRASGPTPGPVHLMFPMDVQRTEVDQADLIAPDPALGGSGASLEHLDRVAQAIASAERPLIIGGSGIYYAGEGPKLIAFAERFRIPVQTPIWDRGFFNDASESFVGVIGAATGGPPLLAEADCVVIAGAATDYRVGFLQPSAMPSAKSVHRVLRGWDELRRRCEALGGAQRTDWLTKSRTARSAHTATIRANGEGQRVPGKLHALDVVDAIGRALPPEGTLIIDGGSIGQWAHQLLCERRYPSHWLTCGRSGVVGYGLAGAMAAKLAHPLRPTLLLAGDGAFTFTLGEIECAVRQKLHYVALVADDQLWGITHTGHLKQFGAGIATELGPIRFDMLAESMGARGVRAADPEQLERELRSALERKEVTVIHAPISGGNPT